MRHRPHPIVVTAAIALALLTAACLPPRGTPPTTTSTSTSTTEPGELVATVADPDVDVVRTGNAYEDASVTVTLTNGTGATLPIGATATVTAPATVGVEGVAGDCVSATLADGASCSLVVVLGVLSSVPTGSDLAVQLSVGKGSATDTAAVTVHTLAPANLVVTVQSNMPAQCASTCSVDVTVVVTNDGDVATTVAPVVAFAQLPAPDAGNNVGSVYSQETCADGALAPGASCFAFGTAGANGVPITGAAVATAGSISGRSSSFSFS